MKNKICGIYKILNPEGKIYIGQSRNINFRKYIYSRCECKNQIILYNSIKKYGFENHKFEIIEECEPEKLNELEIKYIEQYNSFAVKNKQGMNCTAGGTGTYKKIMPKHVLEILTKSHKPLSDKRKQEISLMFKGKKLSEEHIAKLKNRVITEETREKLRFAANNMTQEHKNNISKSLMGRKVTQKTIDAVIKANTGRKKTEREIAKQSERMMGNQYTKGTHLSKEHKAKIGASEARGKHHAARIVIDLSSGIIYDCLVDLCCDKKLSYSSMYAKLTGRNKNDTTYEFL
jgi:group I intron endonuclease